jgi:hypothetical protein
MSSKFYRCFSPRQRHRRFSDPALRTARAVISCEDRLLLTLCLPAASNLSSNEVKERKTHFTIKAESFSLPLTFLDENHNYFIIKFHQ